LSKLPLLPAPKTPVASKPVEQNSILQSVEPQYQTFWGYLNFDEIYERSYRYTYSLLYRDHRFNPENIEDGLQVGYLKLWQRLEKEPDLLAELNIAWLGKFIFNAAFHTRQQEKRITNRQYKPRNSEDNLLEGFELLELGMRAYGKHSPESRQTDKRIDLEWAIVATAKTILKLPSGKEQDRQLWALYGITALQVQVTEASQLFRVNHHAMKAAYIAVQRKLQANLREYTPQGETRPIHNKGRKANPHQDIRQIRLQTAHSPPEHYDEVRKTLHSLKPDTLERDLLALEGIQAKVAARQQARNHQISYSAMQRAYERVHLLLAALVNPTVSPKQVERKRSQTYVFRQEDEPIIRALANELLTRSNSQERLVALYAHLCNLPNRTAARNFQMNEATLRRYRQQVHERLIQLSEEAHNTCRIVSELPNPRASFENNAHSNALVLVAF
jgi:hypothetical protein